MESNMKETNVETRDDIVIITESEMITFMANIFYSSPDVKVILLLHILIHG